MPSPVLLLRCAAALSLITMHVGLLRDGDAGTERIALVAAYVLSTVCFALAGRHPWGVSTWLLGWATVGVLFNIAPPFSALSLTVAVLCAVSAGLAARARRLAMGRAPSAV